MIIAAAIKFGSLVCHVPAPGRHHNVLHLLHSISENGIKQTGDVEQGFLTDSGKFVGRKQALKHARECGQGTPIRDKMKLTDKNVYDGPELFSEDLW